MNNVDEARDGANIAIEVKAVTIASRMHGTQTYQQITCESFKQKTPAGQMTEPNC